MPARKITRDDMIAILSEKYPDYDLSRLPDNIHEKVVIGCPIHGWDEGSWISIKNKGCTQCSIDKRNKKIAQNIKNKHTNILGQYIIDKGNEINDNYYEYNVEPTKLYHKTDKIEIICPRHGPFIQSVEHHIIRKQKCINCANNVRTLEECINDANRIHNNFYDYSLSGEGFVNGSSTIKVICPIHGEWKTNFRRHASSNGSRSQGCQRCAAKKNNLIPKKISRSKNEIYLCELIQENYPFLEITTNDTEILQGNELDILLNDINLAIEWNGEYWHSLEGKKEIDDMKKELLKDDLIQIVDKGRENKIFVQFKFDTVVKPEIDKRIKELGIAS